MFIQLLKKRNLSFIRISGLEFNHQRVENECDYLQKAIEILDPHTDNIFFINAGWPSVKARYNRDIDFNLLSKQVRLHEIFMQLGIRNFVNLGSCYEYGIAYGPAIPNSVTNPVTVYGQEKLELYKRLIDIQSRSDFMNLLWLRVFFVKGGLFQNNNIFDLIRRASDAGLEKFDMTLGEQLLDFICVETLAIKTLEMIDNGQVNGIANACSGAPVSLRRAVEDYVAENKFLIKINFGAKEYRPFESLALWGGKPFELQKHICFKKR